MLQRLQGVVAGGRAAFDDDLDRQDATLRRLQTLSESAHRLSADLKERHPEVRWGPIAGMRNRLVHAYLDVDLDIVWNTLETDLPLLRAVVDGELARLRAEDERPD